MRIGPLNFIIASFLLVTVMKIGEVVISSNLIAKQTTPSATPASSEQNGASSQGHSLPKGNEKTDTPSGTESQKAQTPSAMAHEGKKEASSKEVSAVKDSHGTGGACLTGSFVQAARDKMTRLEQKEVEVEERIRVMQVAEQRVQEQLARLDAAREKISEAAQSAESKMSKDNLRLMQMYEQMKAKDAAEIFNEMDPQVAAVLLRSMKEQKSSQILAAMEPKKAYDVTLMLSSYLKQDEQKIRQVIGKDMELKPSAENTPSKEKAVTAASNHSKGDKPNPSLEKN
jgi:flagellar motility protein MotE (MotC chaperone)